MVQLVLLGKMKRRPSKFKNQFSIIFCTFCNKLLCPYYGKMFPEFDSESAASWETVTFLSILLFDRATSATSATLLPTPHFYRNYVTKGVWLLEQSPSRTGEILATC